MNHTYPYARGASRRTILAFLAALLSLAPLAWAQQAPGAQQASAQNPLTDKEVVKLIADWPSAMKWFDDRNQKIAQSAEGDLPAALFTNKDFEAFIGGRGWSPPQRFYYVAGEAFWLAGVVGVERKNPDMAKQFDDAIAQIQASDMSPDDKAQNIQTLEEAKRSALGYSSSKDVNQAELAAVRPHYDELMKLAQSQPGK